MPAAVAAEWPPGEDDGAVRDRAVRDREPAGDARLIRRAGDVTRPRVVRPSSREPDRNS